MCAGTNAFRSDTPEDDDDEGGHTQPRTHNATAAAASASAASAAAAGGAAGSNSAQAEAATVAAAISKLPATPRLRTRLFAAELLLSLFAAVGPDGRHRFPQPKYGNTTGSGEAGQTGMHGPAHTTCIPV